MASPSSLGGGGGNGGINVTGGINASVDSGAPSAFGLGGFGGDGGNAGNVDFDVDGNADHDGQPVERRTIAEPRRRRWQRRAHVSGDISRRSWAARPAVGIGIGGFGGGGGDAGASRPA